MAFMDETQTLAELENMLKNKFSGLYEYNRSSSTQLELQMAGVNKSRLVEPFKELYAQKDIKMTVYACGDNENDIAMLKKADVSVCPSNAIDEVKAICDMCLCSNNEGVIADLIYGL